MPLPTKTLRVFPNPWTLIHAERGAEGRCHVDTAGRGGIVRFIGAEIDTDRTRVTEARPDGDPRYSRQETFLKFPALNDALNGPAKGAEKGIEVAKTGYYLGCLRNGELIPADDATAAAANCKFKSLKDAKDAGIAEFESHHGKGTYAELEKRLTDAARDALERMKKAAEAAAAPEQPTTDTASSGGKK